MKKYSEELANKERWLILNKIDMLSKKELSDCIAKIKKALKWKGKIFAISALSKIGTDELCYKLMEYIECNRSIETDPKNS